MRTAITFWQMLTDEAALFEFLRSTGPLRARVSRSVPESEAIAFRPLSAIRRHNFGVMLICRKKDPEFKKWAKAVVAWIKARCTETCNLNGFDYPATPAVAAAVAEEKIVLRL